MIPNGSPGENVQRRTAAGDERLLAVSGGRPVRAEGPPPWPPNDPDVLEALRLAHEDGSWGRYHGRWCGELEARLAEYHRVPLASVCCSGTFAVELALRGLAVKPGDEVLMAGYDFSGNFHSILAVGARPVLVDLNPDNWMLDANLLEAAVGPQTRAVIATHLHGGVVPMRAVCEVARRHGLKVVEDAAQMPGATIEGRKAGTWGDVGILSFGGSKLLSAGRGGAILTRHAEVHHRAKLFCNRGNHAFPLSELQAAVVLPQLEKLDRRNAQRAENVAYLLEALREFDVLRPLENTWLSDAPATSPTEPGYYKLGFRYDPEALGGLARERFVQAMRAEGIALDAGFRSLAGRSSTRCRKMGPLDESRKAHELMVVLHHPILLGTRAEMDQIAAAVRKVCEAGGGD